MSILPLILIFLIGIVYLDFSIWYSAEMHNIWNDDKRKFKGVFAKFWDWIGR